MHSIQKISLFALLLSMGCNIIPKDEHYKPRFEAAGGNPRNGGTFVFSHESNVRSLDPNVAYDELSTMANRLMFDGLLDYDLKANLIPSLATTLPVVTNNGKTFRFRLRKGVLFHPMPGLPNGRELTAKDVEWSMLRLLSKDVGSPGYPFYKSIVGAEEYHAGKSKTVSGIKVIDAYTIDFELGEPDQTFLNAMAMPFAYPMPMENAEHWGDAMRFHPVGTGPFILEKDGWERGVALTFIRNKKYWNKKGRSNPDRMIFQENLKRNISGLRFLNGELDAIHRTTTNHFLRLNKNKEWDAHSLDFPDVNSWGIGMNCELAPFDNVHVRRAVAFAIDRKSWARARNNRLLPSGQILPPQIPGHDPNLPELQRFNLKKAKEEMKLAGHPNGLDEEVNFTLTEGDVGRIYGELLQEDLKKIGIKVRVRQVSFATYLQETGKPKTVQMFNTGWSMDFPDPANFLDILFHSRSIHPKNSENRSFYRNPELDALLDAARGELDRKKRIGLFQKANNIVSRDAPWAFYMNSLKKEYWQPYVKNYTPHPVFSENYRDVWIDGPRKRLAQFLDGNGFPSRLATAVMPLSARRPLVQKRSFR